MNYFLLTALTLPIMCAYVPATASEQQPIKITSIEFGEGLQKLDGTGFYADMLASLLNLTDIKNAVSVYTFKRAIVNFYNHQVDCIWPLDIALLRQLNGQNATLIESHMLFMSHQHIFTRENDPVVSSLKDIEGELVAVSNGSNIADLLTTAGVKLEYVPRQNNKVDMLFAKRVNAIAGWTPDLLITSRILGHPAPNYDKDFVITNSGVGIVCHDTPNNQAFIEKLNPYIDTLITSDTFKEISERYGVSSVFE